MTLVISLGGSVINPGKIDTCFVKRFKELVLWAAKKERVIIVCGGGRVCRDYRDALSPFNQDPPELDRMGIYATYLNAFYIKSVFKDKAYPKILTEPFKVKTRKRIIVAGGWKPGWSTDYDAVHLAAEYGAKQVLNLSNIKYLYDKDPSKHKGAKAIKSISWDGYLDIIGRKWKPGMHAPFDPVASKLAKRKSISVVLMDGRDLANVKNYLLMKKYSGTIIN
ncbi:UMP kinase [Candidatus Woesearchaeota archaeon]|nr:UMP kinase [Candidatus Woesearchaeota archaeon]